MSSLLLSKWRSSTLLTLNRVQGLWQERLSLSRPQPLVNLQVQALSSSLQHGKKSSLLKNSGVGEYCDAALESEYIDGIKTYTIKNNIDILFSK